MYGISFKVSSVCLSLLARATCVCYQPQGEFSVLIPPGQDNLMCITNDWMGLVRWSPLAKTTIVMGGGGGQIFKLKLL